MICPSCNKAAPSFDGMIKTHFATVLDMRPCPGSGKKAIVNPVIEDAPSFSVDQDPGDEDHHATDVEVHLTGRDDR